jgi:hypothetical protein
MALALVSMGLAFKDAFVLERGGGLYSRGLYPRSTTAALRVFLQTTDAHGPGLSSTNEISEIDPRALLIRVCFFAFCAFPPASIGACGFVAFVIAWDQRRLSCFLASSTRLACLISSSPFFSFLCTGALCIVCSNAWLMVREHRAVELGVEKGLVY